MERSEGGDYEAGGEAAARTRPKTPNERSVSLYMPLGDIPSLWVYANCGVVIAFIRGNRLLTYF